MAVLNIRNLPEEIRDRLRVRAARHGRSMEAEARAILTAACLADAEIQPAAALAEWVDELYGGHKPHAVVDDLIAERRRESRAE
jgi:antitoxin FitA